MGSLIYYYHHCPVALEVAVRMALTWVAPDRSVLAVALASHRKWRFVGNTAQLARVDDLLNALDGFLRRTDDIIDRLADHLHATSRNPRARLATDDTLACQPER